MVNPRIRFTTRSQFSYTSHTQLTSRPGIVVPVPVPGRETDATRTTDAGERPRILVVDDEQFLAELVASALRYAGFASTTASSCAEAEAVATRYQPDLIVLDVMLPGIDGFEVCRRIRRTDQLPIILLTARSDDIDVVVGLESGADDYVVKPVQGRVLDARIRAVLRRGEREANDSASFGNLVIDRAAMTVTKNGEDLQLTPTELRLLLELSRRPGQALSRQQLLRLVWEHDYLGDSRLVDACVQRLRAKVEDVPSSPTLIRTVRGVGYRLDAPQ